MGVLIMADIVLMVCDFCSCGKSDSCIMDAKLIVEDGDIVAMIYCEYALTKFKALNYKLICSYENDILMYLLVMNKNTKINLSEFQRLLDS